MRKIDKNCDLSTVYKAWEEDLESRNEAHPKYGNTKTKEEHYLDIVMQLHRCQGGLCAYTERLLCHKPHFRKNHWKDGKYVSAKPDNNIEGHLDHFDPSLKSKKADATGKKDWFWGNFFVIHGHINSVVKREKPVDDILKPDSKNYDPFTLLDYDFDTHQFKPNKGLDNAKTKKVENMLLTLGVNYFNERRRSYLQDKLKPIFTQSKSWDEIEAIEFPTAFAFCKMKVENGEIGFDDLFAKDVVDKEDL